MFFLIPTDSIEVIDCSISSESLPSLVVLQDQQCVVVLLQPEEVIYFEMATGED